jgi:carbon-monoxide dehydrogenase medium subunit
MVDVDGDGRCRSVRIGMGGVGPTPIRARSVEAALVGSDVDPATVRAAAALVTDDVDPLDDARGTADYKREMASVWVARAILAATGRADVVR